MVGNYDRNEAYYTKPYMKQAEAQNPSIRLTRPVVLVGLMGAGKSKIGRMLATRLGIGFADSDTEIEAAAGLDIPTIFEHYGEEKFRALETGVLKRMLGGAAGMAAPSIISVGGGAFMHPANRAVIQARAMTLWLKAAPETLADRISNPESRPLLKGRDAAAVLEQLAKTRYPIYAEADVTVDTDGLEPHDALEKVMSALAAHLDGGGKITEKGGTP